MQKFDISSVEARKNWVQHMLSSGKPQFFPLEGTNYTVCILTFEDGWSTIGYSVCVSNDDYQLEIGKQIALENAECEAKTHYWRTAGYLAKRGITEI